MGVALGVDRLLLARHLQKSREVAESLPPRLLVAANDSPDCYRIVQAWRAKGAVVIIDVNGHEGTALVEAAGAPRASLALSWSGRGFDVYDPSQPSAAPVRQIASDDKGLINQLLPFR